ncbi:MAG: PqqD family peptide modification chaperone [Turicibacter sanguinis]
MIWDLTAEPISVQGIVEKLIAEYEVTADECELEVKDFLHELHHANLVMIHA